MSFSSDLKNELFKQLSSRRHCQVAELAAIVAMEGHIDEDGCLYVYTDNQVCIEKYMMLIKHLFPDIDTTKKLDRRNSKRILEEVQLDEHMKIAKVLGNEYSLQGVRVKDDLLEETCCKRAFIRGAFIAAGSMSDPRKAYHFEIVCHSKLQAEQLKALLISFEGEAKIVERTHRFVVYLKEGSQIVDTINVMEAYVSLMNLENIRIEKEMRGSINRLVNCETANINKTVTAAVRQVQDIELIRDTIGLSALTDSLREMAEVRLENPDTALKDLGELLSPPVGKSGVNHRLRKISEIAEKIKDGSYE